MKRISALTWRGSALMVLGLVSILGLKAVTSQSLECYSCTDQGDGGCVPENTVNVTCSPDHDVCLETISAIKTSHESHIILKKGCGYSIASKQDKTIPFHGISIFVKMNECNSSFCNSDFTLKSYLLAADDNVTHVPNDGQCYSCIGKPSEECSSSNTPVAPCYNSYSYCFDGNVTISMNNDTTLIPVKSCSLRYRCAVHTVTYSSLCFEIKGACCSGDLCNHDLSNKTQLGDLPFLVLLSDKKQELTTPTLPPRWVIPTPLPTTTCQDEETQPSPNSTASSHSSYEPREGQGNNTAHGLLHAPWLIFILICLS